MSGTTIKEFASKLESSANETFRKNNPHLFNRSAQSNPDIIIEPKSAFQSTEQNLNKLETRWLAVLRAKYCDVGIQRFTLRLSNGVRYTPDFDVPSLSTVRFFETKGLHRFREKGILKLKWAATEYPFFDFVLVTWNKDSGQWSETLMPKK